MTRFNETGEAIPFELRPARQCVIEVGVAQSNTIKTSPGVEAGEGQSKAIV